MTREHLGEWTEFSRLGRFTGQAEMWLKVVRPTSGYIEINFWTDDPHAGELAVFELDMPVETASID